MKETLAITGMGCGHCVISVRKALENIEGVEVEQVEIGSAEVEYDPGQIARQKLADAIKEEGFDLQPAA